MHEDAVLLTEVMVGFRGNFVASDAGDVMSVNPIEIFGGLRKTAPDLSGTKIAWVKSLKGSLKKKKLWEVADGVLEE